MALYYFTPTSNEKNLGKAYNDHMALLPNNDDWACLTDRDSMFIQEDYWAIIRQGMIDNPNAGVLTGYTNRVGERRQCYTGSISEVADIRHHAKIGKKLSNQPDTYLDFNFPISGVCMIVKKSTWIDIKFKDGMLGVDNWFSQSVLDSGRDIKLIERLYIFHYYRLLEGINYKNHLK